MPSVSLQSGLSNNPQMLMEGALVTELLTMDMFADLVDREFIVDVDDSHSVGMELIEIYDISDSRGGKDPSRASFSLVFRGPDEPIYPEGTYRFEHEELGAFNILITPAGPDTDGMRYEAVFDHA
jgi:hypothetical protein